MTYVPRWYQLLVTLQVAITTGPLNKRLIKICDTQVLFSIVLTHSYLIVLKSWQGDKHQKALQAKIGKYDLKALYTTYKMNPEVFDNEPTELLSDIDRNEDNIVSILFFFVLNYLLQHISLLIGLYLPSHIMHGDLHSNKQNNSFCISSKDKM